MKCFYYLRYNRENCASDMSFFIVICVLFASCGRYNSAGKPCWGPVSDEFSFIVFSKRLYRMMRLSCFIYHPFINLSPLSVAFHSCLSAVLPFVLRAELLSITRCCISGFFIPPSVRISPHTHSGPLAWGQYYSSQLLLRRVCVCVCVCV